MLFLSTNYYIYCEELFHSLADAQRPLTKYDMKCYYIRWNNQDRKRSEDKNQLLHNRRTKSSKRNLGSTCKWDSNRHEVQEPCTGQLQTQENRALLIAVDAPCYISTQSIKDDLQFNRVTKRTRKWTAIVQEDIKTTNQKCILRCINRGGIHSQKKTDIM